MDIRVCEETHACYHANFEMEPPGGQDEGRVG